MNWASTKEWFSTGYDSYKWIIVISMPLILILGGLFFFQWSRNASYEAAIASGEKDLKEIYRKASEVYEVRKQLNDDALAEGTTNIAAYFSTHAYSAGIGEFKDFRGRTVSGTGYEDTVFDLVPNPKDKLLSRQQIAKFLHDVEDNTTRLSVTKIKLDHPAKGFEPGQRRDDEWVFAAEVTSRKRTEKKSR